MFCCCIKRQEGRASACPVVDVERVLQDFVWAQFTRRFNRCQKACLRRSNFEVDVPMRYFHFETLHQRLIERSLPGEGSDGRLWRNQQEAGQTAGKAAGSKIEAARQARPGAVELRTTFHNGTGDDQKYAFRLEKTRRSKVNVTMQRGFSIGGKAKFDLKLPSVAPGVTVGAGAEVDVRYTITKAEGEEIEESATFETKSDINVKENSECVAKVIMDEVSINYDFRVKCLMTVLADGAPSTIKRKKDGKIFFSYLVSNLSRVFKPYKSEYVNLYPKLEDMMPRGGQAKGDNQGNGGGTVAMGDNKDGMMPRGGQAKGDNQGNGGGTVAMGDNRDKENKEGAKTEFSNLVGDKILFKIYGVIDGVRLSDQRITLDSTRLLPSANQTGSEVTTENKDTPPSGNGTQNTRD